MNPEIDPSEAIHVAIEEKRREITRLETVIEALQSLRDTPSALDTLMNALKGVLGKVAGEVGPRMLKRMVVQLLKESETAMRVSAIAETLVKERLRSGGPSKKVGVALRVGSSATPTPDAPRGVQVSRAGIYSPDPASSILVRSILAPRGRKEASALPRPRQSCPRPGLPSSLFRSRPAAAGGG